MSKLLGQVAAVILAGGFGTRIKHLLADIPKPMAPVQGRPFLEWVVRYLAAEGVNHVVISTGYLAEVVEQHFRKQPVKGISVICVKESNSLGTAGGFINAATLSGHKPDSWLVLNGDSLALTSLASITDLRSDPSIEGLIFGVQMKDASRFGTIVQDCSGNLAKFEEKKDGSGVINAGIYLFRSSLLNRFPTRKPLSFEKDVFPEFIQQRVRLGVHVSNAPFLDIGTPESLPMAEAFIQQYKKWFLP